MKTKDTPIPDGTKFTFRNKVAYVMECINLDKHRNHEYRYYVDSAGWRYSLIESEILSSKRLVLPDVGT